MSTEHTADAGATQPAEPLSQQRRLATAVVGLAATAALTWLARRVNHDGRLPGDETIHERIQVAPAAVRGTGSVLSALTHPATYIPAALLTMRWLDRRGVAGGRLLVGTVAGTWIAYRAMKLVIERERPGGDSNHPDDASFPSGHTAGMTAFALTLAHLLSRSGAAPARVVVPIAVAAPIVTGAARILADEHWTSDTVGGVLLGVAAASVATEGFERSIGA